METTTTTITINKSEKPNSYEFGKAGNRFKLYFDTPLELRNLIAELNELNIGVEE